MSNEGARGDIVDTEALIFGLDNDVLSGVRIGRVRSRTPPPHLRD